MVKKPVQPKQPDPEQPSVRDLLLDRVRTGEITPDDAEAEAAKLSIPPLRTEPNQASYDPMTETWWTLPMAIAWIVWRTPGAVREWWDSYRAERRWWQSCRWSDKPGGPVYEGFDLQSVPRASWSLLALRTDYPKQRTRDMPWRPRSPRDARKELWEALGAGDLEAEAIDLATDARVIIPASIWENLDIISERGGDTLRTDPLSRTGYGDVLIRSETVIHAWPPRTRPTERLPPLMRPTGPGYMPLSAAVQWIATKGGTNEVALSDTETWDLACRELADRIASGEVRATGTREGRSQMVDPALFAGIVIRHLYGPDDGLGGADTNELYLFSYPYLDEEHWRGGFDDRLQTRWRESWTKLMVLRADVARWWPFDLAPVVSGLPGRPTSAHLLVAEFERRCLSDQVDRSVMANAESLCEWLAHAHPSMPQPRPKASRIESEASTTRTGAEN